MGKIICLGYHCICGEKVAVARLAQGDDFGEPIPPAATVSCSRGHIATVTADQFAVLEHWEEEEGAEERDLNGRRTIKSSRKRR
jgi:hypothetical protein